MAVRKPAKTPAAAPAAPKAVAETPVVETVKTPEVEAPKPAPKPAAKAAKPAAVVDAAAVQANLRDAAVKSLEQGKAAYGRMKEATEEAAHSLEASFAATSKGAHELASKAIEIAKANANASFDHLKALASVKTLSDAINLHGQFIRTQSETAVAQAKEFAEIAKKTATETAAPIQQQLKKPLSKA